MLFYKIEPDECSYFVSISDLTEYQKEYIVKNVFIYPDLKDIMEDEDEDDCKYYIDACFVNGIYDSLINYLNSEGYILKN